MARAGIAAGCSTIELVLVLMAGACLFTLESQPQPRCATSFTLTPDKEGSCDEQRLGPLHHHLSDWPRKNVNLHPQAQTLLGRDRA